MLRLTSLIACLAGHGRQVSQIATAIFLPRPDAKALGDSVHLGGFGLRRTASSLV